MSDDIGLLQPSSLQSTKAAVVAHLGFIGMGFLAPLTVYLLADSSDRFTRDHAVEALNFQLTFLIVDLSFSLLVDVLLIVALLVSVLVVLGVMLGGGCGAGSMVREGSPRYQ